MKYFYFIKYYSSVIVVELEVLRENLDIERAIREVAIERCKQIETGFSQEGIDYISFFRDLDEELCKKNGFIIRNINSVTGYIVDGTQKIVSADEALFHVAFGGGRESYNWDYVMTALALAKMCSTSKKRREIKEFQLLEWGAEFVNGKGTDLESFFKDKINEL